MSRVKLKTADTERILKSRFDAYGVAEVRREFLFYVAARRVVVHPSGRYTEADAAGIDHVLRVARRVWPKEATRTVPLGRLSTEERLVTKQGTVYALFGPDLPFLADSAVHQPADFYFDDRVGRPYYSKPFVERKVERLAAWAKANGFDPHRLPKTPTTHHCGVWT
jgi:hypothetical protein